MAIKPIAKEFVPFVDELLSLGLLDPKMAHSGQAVENAMNPKASRELAPEMTKPKGNRPARPYTEMEKVNANMDRRIGNRGTIQPTDQEWLDSVSTAIEKNKALIARYGSIPAALAAGEVLADPVDDLRTSEAQWDMTPEERAIADLRASEASFGNQNPDVADAYTGASTLWDNVGTSLKNVGVPAGLVDLLQPTYESSAAKAAGDDSAMTGLFAMLEKLDPVAYAGLLGSEYLKRKK